MSSTYITNNQWNTVANETNFEGVFIMRAYALISVYPLVRNTIAGRFARRRGYRRTKCPAVKIKVLHLWFHHVYSRSVQAVNDVEYSLYGYCGTRYASSSVRLTDDSYMMPTISEDCQFDRTVRSGE